MKNLRVCTVALALIGLPAPASAQNGATWVDAHGRMVSVEFPGSGDAPAPAKRPAAEMAALFKRLCLDSGGGEAGLAAAATTAGLTANSHMVSDGIRTAGTIPLRVWTGEGVAASRTDGFFGVPLAQCSATFYAAGLPDRQEVVSAVSQAIGAQPSNLAAATDKKGRPKKNYLPEWTLAGPSGFRTVTAMVMKASNYDPENKVQLAVRASKKPAKGR